MRATEGSAAISGDCFVAYAPRNDSKRMMEQNQNQNLFDDMNQPEMPLEKPEEEKMEMEQPALQPREAVSGKIDVNIQDATTKSDFKDLEISFNFEKIELIKKIVRDTENNLRRINCLLGEESPKIQEKIKIRTQFGKRPETGIQQQIGKAEPSKRTIQIDFKRK